MNNIDVFVNPHKLWYVVYIFISEWYICCVSDGCPTSLIKQWNLSSKQLEGLAHYTGQRLVPKEGFYFAFSRNSINLKKEVKKEILKLKINQSKNQTENQIGK